jgi:hypothetical protein
MNNSAMQVRVRTAQLAERNHSTEGRLTYVEDHVTKIRSKMKQIRVRSTDCRSTPAPDADCWARAACSFPTCYSLHAVFQLDLPNVCQLYSHTIFQLD